MNSQTRILDAVIASNSEFIYLLCELNGMDIIYTLQVSHRLNIMRMCIWNKRNLIICIYCGHYQTPNNRKYSLSCCFLSVLLQLFHVIDTSMTESILQLPGADGGVQRITKLYVDPKGSRLICQHGNSNYLSVFRIDNGCRFFLL